MGKRECAAKLIRRITNGQRHYLKISISVGIVNFNWSMINPLDATVKFSWMKKTGKQDYLDQR